MTKVSGKGLPTQDLVDGDNILLTHRAWKIVQYHYQSCSRKKITYNRHAIPANPIIYFSASPKTKVKNPTMAIDKTPINKFMKMFITAPLYMRSAVIQRVRLI